MKRFFACLFLFLYLYNWAGYLAVFSIQQANIRKEIKKMLKEGVPEQDLVPFAFHTPSLEEGVYPIQWLKKNEFRYAGGVYDIVRSRVSHDTTYFQCVNDVQEERLFADLDQHVRREMGGASQSRLHAFNDVFKDSFSQRIIIRHDLLIVEILPELPLLKYKSVDIEEPFPPPRTFSLT